MTRIVLISLATDSAYYRLMRLLSTMDELEMLDSSEIECDVVGKFPIKSENNIGFVFTEKGENENVSKGS